MHSTGSHHCYLRNYLQKWERFFFLQVKLGLTTCIIDRKFQLIPLKGYIILKKNTYVSLVHLKNFQFMYVKSE